MTEHVIYIDASQPADLVLWPAVRRFPTLQQTVMAFFALTEEEQGRAAIVLPEARRVFDAAEVSRLRHRPRRDASLAAGRGT